MPTDQLQGAAEAKLSLTEEQKRDTSECLLRDTISTSYKPVDVRASGAAGEMSFLQSILPKLSIENSETTRKETPEVREQMKAEIEKKYGVVFETKETCPPQDRDKLREPTLAELEILEWALSKNQAAVKPNIFSLNKMSIMFSNETKGASAYHSSENGMFANSRVVINSTEKVLSKEDTKDGQSLGSVLLHEFGHRSSFMTKHDIAELGWRKIGPKDDDLAIETKDGRLYQFVEEKNAENQRTDIYWRLVDENGNSLEDQPQGRLTDQQMSEQEKISQPMRPANNPSETFANAMRMYCQNEETRKELQTKCPDMYLYIEEYDRKALSRLGRDFFGINEYVRDKNGDIVRNPQAWNPVLV